ncbi:hypothetical protein SNK03_010571 [Fusarium graminearum]
MKARGAIWRQIPKVNRVIDLKQQEEEGGECKVNAFIGQEAYDWVHDPFLDEKYANCQLPGLVWPRDDQDCQLIYYRGWFFAYHDADANCTLGIAENHAISLVRFNTIPLEWDKEQDGFKQWDPMDYPICSQPIPVLNEGSDYYLGSW